MSDEGYANLGNAVVQFAVNDYRWALWYIERFNEKSKRYKEAVATRDECVRFFKSEYFNVFTLLDGKALLQCLNRESRDHRTYCKW